MAIEKLDDYTIRLNGRQPMLAVPESLFHYTAPILHPKENGVFGVGSIGTGAFTLSSFELGKKAVLKRRDGYWGPPAKLDEVVIIDNGDDPAAAVAALASGQVDGMYEASTLQYSTLQKLPNVAIHQVTTAQTAVARMQQDKDPFRDPRVRKAMRLAVDSSKVLQVSYLGLGAPGEHHHISPVHPEYYELPAMTQNIAEAKKLLAEAGVPDGFECTIFCKKDPDWEAISVQAMVNMWKQIGVKVTMNVLPSAQYWDHWTSEAFAYTPWTHRPLGTMVLDLAYRTGVPWNESHYANPKLDALLDKSREKISARILTIKEGEGKTREVTIDRGSDDGFKAGDEGSLWAIYSKNGDKVRKVQKIGASHIKSVSADSGVVVVTMDDPKDDKLVQVGDMVEMDARVPPLSDRSALWRLARYHISFTSEDGERVFSDYRKLYREEDPDLVNKILAQMRTEITRQALRISDNEIMKTVIKNGRFKDKTLKQVLDNPTNEDLQAMMAEMLQYPATYYGKDMKLFRTFAAWVLDEPK